MIESIVVNNKVYFFFKCCFPKFCFPENDTSVFGTEKAFVLCDLWVTDSCYKNTRIVNCTTGNHPVFLGSLIFQFTKDKSTLSRFALEMMEIDSSISHLKKVGTNMNESVYSGVKVVIPEAIVLCSSLASTWWKKELDGLFGKTKYSVSERNCTNNNILKGIYGDQAGSLLIKQKVVA